MKQLLSPQNKFPTKTKQKKENKHLSKALLPLVLGQLRTISSTSAGTPSGLLPKILCDLGASFFFVSSLSCFVSTGKCILICQYNVGQ